MLDSKETVIPDHGEVKHQNLDLPAELTEDHGKQIASRKQTNKSH